MENIIQQIDWIQLIQTLWTVVLLPVITYIGTEAGRYAKEKRIDKYTDILYSNILDAVKDVYETVVKDIKGTDQWTAQAQTKAKELAKAKAVSALTASAYQVLKTANHDFDKYLDHLIGAALYDLKHR